MNTTTTTLRGKEIELKFGSWSVIQLERAGIPLSEIQDFINKNPITSVCKIAYLSACNAKSCDLDAYKENDFTDWIDEHGMSSNEIKKVLDLFVSWATRHGEKANPKKKQ